MSMTAFYINILGVKNTEKRGDLNFVTHNLATEASHKYKKFINHIVAPSARLKCLIVYAMPAMIMRMRRKMPIHHGSYPEYV